MQNERARLIQQVLDGYRALEYLWCSPPDRAAGRLAEVLDTLSPAELDTLAAAFACLARAARRAPGASARPSQEEGETG